ncbi:MAG: hypothetical protein O2V44_09345 [Candidatus Bathyarchaeota archaeon]|nr:hypothetical protein [Candidatus Bathyarchaeota archaeon]
MVNVLFPYTLFFLVTTAIIILIACCITLLVNFKAANESYDFSVEPELLQETSDELILKTNENLSAERRRELLEKIKEDRIKEYLDQKKRKFT